MVAGEVRNLAQRSAQAAREIKSLISDSVEKVDAGSKQVADAGAAMSQIVAQVKRVTDLFGEITSASLEQSSGIGQVNDAITQMDQVKQQNAALVQKSAAAASSLKKQAGKLAEAVTVFKLSQRETRRVIAQAQGAARRGFSKGGEKAGAQAHGCAGGQYRIRSRQGQGQLGSVLDDPPRRASHSVSPTCASAETCAGTSRGAAVKG